MNASIFLKIAAILCLVGCGHRPNNVVYVFPDNFRGVFRLIANSTNGISLVSTNGITVINVPSNGVLMIEQRLPNLQWHTPSARTISGAAIPIFDASGSISKDTIALRCLGNTGTNETVFVLGTYDDAARERKTKRGVSWSSGK
jgi:hypothetical protein